jgi:hypothetical protein
VGDKNTNLFHNQAQTHLTRNNVVEIMMDDGTKVTEFNGIKEESR